MLQPLAVLTSLTVSLLTELPAPAIRMAPSLPRALELGPSALLRPAAKPEVALVSFLAGRAGCESPTGLRRALRLWDRLPEDSCLVVEPASRVALVFNSGRRYLILENVRVRLGKTEIVREKGVEIHVLPLPPIRRRSFEPTIAGTPISEDRRERTGSDPAPTAPRR
jgi:hypothetical protein